MIYNNLNNGKENLEIDSNYTNGVFSLEEIKKLEQLIFPILDDINKIKLVNWSPDEIRKNFGKRSINQIINDGDSFYFNPCGDLTSVLNYKLGEEGIPNILVVSLQKYQNRDVLHVSSEFEIDSQYAIHFKERKIVEIMKGKYENTRDKVKSSKEIRKFYEPLDPDKNLFDIFSHHGLDKYINLEAQIEKMIRDNENPDPDTLEYIKSLSNDEPFKLFFYDKTA